jgi:hypothetical protein
MGEVLATNIEKNTKRYHDLFYEAVDRLIPRVDSTRIVRCMYFDYPSSDPAVG